jgi:hypothetical protein
MTKTGTSPGKKNDHDIRAYLEPLVLAFGISYFRSVESNEADIWLVSINSYRIAVDNAHVGRFYRLRHCRSGKAEGYNKGGQQYFDAALHHFSLANPSMCAP